MDVKDMPEEAHPLRAELLVAAEKWPLALRELNTILAHNPESVREHYLAGICYFNLDDYTRARKAAENALRLNPEYSPAHYLLANIALRCARYREGFRAINRALALDPEHADYLVVRAGLLLNSGKHKQALKIAEQALSHAPEHGIANHVRVLALVCLRRTSEADIEVVRALSRSPDDAIALYQQGSHLLAQGNAGEAKRAFLESLRIDPENPVVQNALLTAISVKHPFFAGFWKWTFFLTRFPPILRILIPMGIIVGLCHLIEVMNDIPALEPFGVWVVLVFWLLWLYLVLSPSLLRRAIRKGWIK